MDLEYIIVKIWQRKASHASNKMVSPMNVATHNVMSQCFYVKVHQIYRNFIHLYSYCFNM